jgi:tRNA C32,U32 (ribose-2'-O)-methylase TrmJ
MVRTSTSSPSILYRLFSLSFSSERSGLGEEVLAVSDDVVEIPVYQLPHSLNVASAASIAIYEVCTLYIESYVQKNLNQRKVIEYCLLTSALL